MLALLPITPRSAATPLGGGGEEGVLLPPLLLLLLLLLLLVLVVVSLPFSFSMTPLSAATPLGGGGEEGGAMRTFGWTTFFPAAVARGAGSGTNVAVA